MTLDNNEFFQEGDQKLMDEWFSHIKASEGTRRIYSIGVDLYLRYHEMSLEDMLIEAENEISEGVKPRKRKLKKRLMSFRESLDKQSDNTKYSYLTAVRSFYKSMDVELPSNRRFEKTYILEENSVSSIRATRTT